MYLPASVYGGVASSIILLAESGLPGEVVGPAGIVIGGGFAVWYGWYVTTRIQPEQQRRHDEVMAAKDEVHERMVTRLVQSFDTNVQLAFSKMDTLNQQYRDDMKAERDLRHELRNELAKLSHKIDILKFRSDRTESETHPYEDETVPSGGNSRKAGAPQETR